MTRTAHLRFRPSGAPLGLLLALCAVVLWSGNFVVARALHESVPPVQTAFWRWVLALVAVAPFALRGVWRGRALVRRHLGYLAPAALLGVAAFNTLIYLAGQSTPAATMAMIAAASPVLIVVLGGRMPGRRALAGLLLALAGVVGLVAKGSLATLLALDFHTGEVLMLVATLTFAGYSALLRRRPAELPPLTFLWTTFALGTLMLLPCYLVSLAVQGGFAPTPGTCGALLYVGVASSALAYAAWNAAVARVGAARAGVTYYLQPVVTAVLSVVLLGESVTLAQAAWLVPVLAGVALGSASPAGRRRSLARARRSAGTRAPALP